MQLFKVEKTWDAANKHFPIIFLGDCHVGSPNCDYKLLEEEIQEIAEMKNAIVFLMGDQAEWITMEDKRFKATGIDRRFWSRMEELPMAYLDYLENLFSPIAHMIEVVHDGNHENAMFPNMYPGAELCSRLRRKVETTHGSQFAQNKLRYAPGVAYTKIMWQYKNEGGKYRSVMVNTAHGWQAGRQQGAKVNEMARMFEWTDAEICVRGHSHEKFLNPGPPRESPNNNMTKLRHIQTMYGHSGSYLKTVELTERPSYAELAGYRPLERGHIEVHVDLSDQGLRKSIHVS